MKSAYVFILILLLFSNSRIRINAQTNDENFYTAVNTPFCASILANDAGNPTLTSVLNGTNGYTFRNYPAFFLGNNSAANNYMISMAATSYQAINYGSTSISPYYVSTGDSWSVTNYLGLPVVFVGPNDGGYTGNGNWGIAVGYNIAIYQPGTYYIWVYGSGGANDPGNADSFHVLSRSPKNSAINFMTMNNNNLVLISYTSSFSWQRAPVQLTVSAAETAWPLSIFNFYIAMREDGLNINQIVLTQSSSTSFGGTSYNSPLISCSSSQVLYFPAKGFTGLDTFQYNVNNGTATYTSTARVYVGTPIPSPSTTPTRTPTPSPSSSATPSRTPTPSVTPSSSPSVSPTPSVTPTVSPSVTPTVTPSSTPSPSVTPSVTPSISVSPSALASPSTTPSRTPSNTPTASVTPSGTPTPTPSVTPSRSPSVTPTSSTSPTSSVTPTASMTPTVTPSATLSPSSSPTPSATPTTSITPSVTPSPNPEICVNWFYPSTTTKKLISSQSTSNFGQTFRPPASGSLRSFSFKRSANDTGIVNATAYLFLGIATEPESGISIRAFPVSMVNGGFQIFNFTPPIIVDNVRYTFLLEDTQGANATMEISSTLLANQYSVVDQEISPTETAIFGFCMVPDYMPSLDPSPSATPSPTTSASTAPSDDESSSSTDGTTTLGSNLPLILGAGLGGLVMVTCFVSFLVIRKKRKSKEERRAEMLEMSPPPSDTNQPNYQPIVMGNYQPIGNAFDSSQPTASSATVRNSLIFESRTNLEASSWMIPFKDLKMDAEVGRGAYGVVYKGRWQGITVAIKHLILDQESVDESKIRDFFGEAELMMKLKGHPNITQLLGICFEPICLITEFVDNGSLRKFLSSDLPVDKTAQVQIARDIAAGMLYLHNEGVIHRDLAARNILLDSKMRAKVSDFGMSRIVLDNSDVNKTGANIGPVRWMAPEAMKQRVYNKKTDIWSYGVVVYEIITRKIPYSDADLINIATSVILQERSLVPEIEKDQHKYPSVLVRIIRECLRYNPQDRPLFDNIIEIFDDTSVALLDD